MLILVLAGQLRCLIGWHWSSLASSEYLRKVAGMFLLVSEQLNRLFFRFVLTIFLLL